MVFIVKRHTHRPFKESKGVGGIVGHASREAVGFQVSFADDKYAHLIAKLVPPGAVGVMAGPHGVYVHALHLANLFPHMFHRYGPAAPPAMLVAVHPVNKKPLSVQVHNAMPNFDFPESDSGTFHIKYLSIPVEEGDYRRIKFRRSRRPFLYCI